MALGCIHRVVSGAKKTVLGSAIFWVIGDSDTCRPMQNIDIYNKWIIETIAKPTGNLLDIGVVFQDRNQHCKLVSAESRQEVAGAELVLHPPGSFLKVTVADVMTVKVVHLLEIVEIDIDQSEDLIASLCPRD